MIPSLRCCSAGRRLQRRTWRYRRSERSWAGSRPGAPALSCTLQSRNEYGKMRNGIAPENRKIVLLIFSSASFVHCLETVHIQTIFFKMGFCMDGHSDTFLCHFAGHSWMRSDKRVQVRGGDSVTSVKMNAVPRSVACCTQDSYPDRWYVSHKMISLPAPYLLLRSILDLCLQWIRIVNSAPKRPQPSTLDPGQLRPFICLKTLHSFTGATCSPPLPSPPLSSPLVPLPSPLLSSREYRPQAV